MAKLSMYARKLAVPFLLNLIKIGTRSVHVGSLRKSKPRHSKLQLYIAKHCDYVKHA